MEKFKKWLDNYWYHYKWLTIFVLVAVFFLAVTVTQSVTNTNCDALILYAGPFDMTVNQKTELEGAFSSLLEKDANGDGKKLCQINEIVVMTREQLESAKAEALEEGIVMTVHKENLTNAQNSFTSELFAGESVICLVDPAQYQNVLANNGWVKLEDTIGYRPDNAFDDYSIKFSDTQFSQYYTACSILPDNMLLCIKQRSIVSSFSSEEKEAEKYNYSIELFKNILDFEFPIGYTPETVAEETSLE